MIDNGFEGGYELRETIVRLLPVLIIALIMIGYALYVGLVIFPMGKDYETVNSAMSTNEAAIMATATEIANDPGVTIYQTQLETAVVNFDTLSQSFLSEADVNTILVALYTNAENNEVSIINLQTQPIAQQDNASIYNTILFRLQAEGSVPNLMNFVIYSQDLTVPTVSVSNFSILENKEVSLLTMDLTLHISLQSSSSILENTNYVELPTPPSEPLLLASPSPEIPEMATTTDVVTVPGESIPVADNANNNLASNPAPIDPSSCGSAPPPMFAVNEVVIVDFNDGGALNMLSAARTGSQEIEIETVLYDNAHMTLINGPICGTWEGLDVWYWYVDYQGLTGWVGEATIDDRYLCPESNPECS